MYSAACFDMALLVETLTYLQPLLLHLVQQSCESWSDVGQHLCLQILPDACTVMGPKSSLLIPHVQPLSLCTLATHLLCERKVPAAVQAVAVEAAAVEAVAPRAVAQT